MNLYNIISKMLLKDNIQRLLVNLISNIGVLNCEFTVFFTGAGGILSPVDRGYSSGDGRVRSSANQPGLYSHMNQLHDNGN